MSNKYKGQICVRWWDDKTEDIYQRFKKMAKIITKKTGAKITSANIFMVGMIEYLKRYEDSAKIPKITKKETKVAKKKKGKQPPTPIPAG